MRKCICVAVLLAVSFSPIGAWAQGTPNEGQTSPFPAQDEAVNHDDHSYLPPWMLGDTAAVDPVAASTAPAADASVEHRHAKRRRHRYSRMAFFDE